MHRISVIFIPCAFLVAVSVFGQDVSAPAKVDPFAFSVSGWLETTDNRDATERGEDNTDFFISPRVDIKSKIEGGLLSFYYAPAYRYRTDPSDIQNDSDMFHYLGLSVERKAGSRTHLRLNENFNYTDDPAVNKYGTTLRRDSSYIYNSLDAGLTYNFNRTTYTDMSASYFMKRYDEKAVADQSDEDRIGGNIMLLREIYERTAMVGSIGYADYGYEVLNGVDRGFSSVIGAVGLESVMSHDSRFGLRLGVQSVTYNDSNIDSEVSPYADLSVIYARVETTRFKGRVAYQIRESDSFPFASQSALDFNLGIEHDYTASITLGFDGLYHLGDYENEDVSPAGAYAFAKKMEGTEESITMQGSVRYNFDDFSYISLAQRHEHVESDVRNTFSRNATTLAFSRRF